MNRVLIITHEALGERMAGPAIRCWELASQLSEVASVTLTSLLPTVASHPRFRVVSFEGQTARLKSLAQEHDILLVQGLLLHRFPFLARLGKYLVVDLYDPFLFESYPFYLDGKQDLFEHHWRIQNQLMQEADFAICASERQRDMWLGRYCALRRLEPELYAVDPSFRRLIDVVPFGLPEVPPVQTRHAIKGVVPGISSEDVVLLWGGGVWNWFDPLTVIRAVAELGKERQDIKLYFMGTGSPNPELPAMAMLTRAIEFAEDLGVKDRIVHFNEGWVSYDDRQNYLLDADAGVSAHFDSIETRFSFRTRVLDYLWAGLPILTTDGDSMAELVERERLGWVLPSQDVSAWKSAIRDLADEVAVRRSMAGRVAAEAPRFTWTQAARPLRAYCQEPYRTPKPARSSAALPLRATLAQGWQVLKDQGPVALAGKLRSRLERLR